MPKFIFAHLIGRKAKATEDDDEKTRKAKGHRADDDDENDENAENDDPESEEQDDEKKGRKAKKAKGKKAEDDDDDPDAEDDENAEGEDEDAEDNKDVKKGRRAERKRCATIFGSKHAANRPDMAAHLAFNTHMSANEAINTMRAMGSVQPAMTRVTLDSRMRTEQQVRVGPDASQPATGSPEALVSKMTSLYDANKGTK
ncbi:hypothetical protein [Xenorhabdus bovienii]|uniref:hypothetical protein n=1 Tax=Xenorhabdus bovienii TaxID=40576 RepID=UPI0023B291F7|nr:hypothetical protein [Xenorhabdus bovienii]MDE9588241.1 hypothetical protein [Xenorhabdus bovienii]